MAHQASFSSGHSANSSHSSTPASVSAISAVSGTAPVAAASFSIFQEVPGQALVYSPPRGTPELQSLIDAFIALDIPFTMKMEMIQHDFEAHTQRTGERYKTYVVPAVAAPAANSTSPVTMTPSPGPGPGPIFHNIFEPSFRLISVSAGSASGSGSYLAPSPASRSSPTTSELTVASDSLFPMSTPTFPAPVTSFHGDQPLDVAQSPGFLPTSAMGLQFASADNTLSWPSTSASAAPAIVATSASQPYSRSHGQRQHQRQHHHQPRRRLSGTSSMQILTRDGQDVTNVSSRSTRTTEERENTRIIRQQGACAECRRKKTRCSPSHAGFSLPRTGRAAPYMAPAQSGRAKEAATTAAAAKASKEKAEGKKPEIAAEPVAFAPISPATALTSVTATGSEGGGEEALSGFAPNWDIFQDSFDWANFFTDKELGFNISTSLATAESSSTALSRSPHPSGIVVREPLPSHLQPRRPPAIGQPSTRHTSAPITELTVGRGSDLDDGSTALSDAESMRLATDTLPASSSASSSSQEDGCRVLYSSSASSPGPDPGDVGTYDDLGFASDRNGVLLQQGSSALEAVSTRAAQITGMGDGVGELDAASSRIGEKAGHGRESGLRDEQLRPRHGLSYTVGASPTSDGGVSPCGGEEIPVSKTNLPQQVLADDATICRIFATVASSLVPSLLAWTAIEEARKPNVDSHRCMDSMVSGRSVACQ